MSRHIWIEPAGKPVEWQFSCGCVVVRQAIWVHRNTRRTPYLRYRTLGWRAGPCADSNHDGLTRMRLPETHEG